MGDLGRSIDIAHRVRNPDWAPRVAIVKVGRWEMAEDKVFGLLGSERKRGGGAGIRGREGPEETLWREANMVAYRCFLLSGEVS